MFCSCFSMFFMCFMLFFFVLFFRMVLACFVAFLSGVEL